MTYPELAEVPDERLHLLGAETSGVPVERGRQVVREPLARNLLVDTVGELLGLSVDGALGLHPDEVGVGSESDRTTDGALGAALETEVALTGAGRRPVPEGKLLEAGSLGEAGGLGVRGTLGLLQELGRVDTLGLEGGGESVVVELELGRGGPLVLDLLEDCTALAGSLSLVHELGKGAEVGVGRAKDRGVVAGVDVGGDEGRGLRVGTGNDEVLSAHDVALEAHGNETVNVLRDGDKDLAGHVPTLLGARGLVLNVDTGGTRLDHHLRELHDSGEATVAGVGIGDDGAEVVDVGSGVLALGKSSATGVALLAVVVKLSSEELGDLVGNRVGGVV